MTTPDAEGLGRLIASLAELGRHCGGSVPTRGMAFLYICENEGLSVHELAHVARLTDTTASRSSRSLASPPQALVRLHRHEDYGVMLRLRLTEAGVQLRDRLDAILAPVDFHPSAAVPGRRRRSSLLKVLEAFREVDPTPTLVRALTFMMICEQPGVELAALAAHLGASVASASRSARAFTGQRVPGIQATKAALVEMHIDPKTNRRRHFHPTAEGVAFRQALESMAADFTPLRLGRAHDDRPSRPDAAA